MKPLIVEERLRKLRDQHSSPEAFRDVIDSGSTISCESLVRLWLTEGIPFAFRECPAVYEAARGWLGWRLEVCPKEITLLGSARIGFSLSPPPKYGQAFDDKSDLDLRVISEALFRRTQETFNQWHIDYKQKSVQPKHQREQDLWDQNIQFGLRNIPNGFLNADKIPTLNRYPVVQNMNQATWQLKRKLEITPSAPKPSKVTVRVYSSWRALVSRVSFNLRTALVGQ